MRWPSKHKYSAVQTEMNGILFPSKREARRYGELLLLQKAGAITHLELQKVYSIDLKNKHICNYIADFFYWDRDTQQWTVEDSKGFSTPVFKLKKKLVEAMYDITIKIT